MKENRREFVKKTGVSLAAVSVSGIVPAVSATRHLMPKDNLSGAALQELVSKSKIRIAVQAPAEATATQLSFYKQMGLKQVVLWPDETNVGAEYYVERKKYFTDAGLEIYGINNNSLLNDEKIVLNLPGRDERIELYKQHLRALGKAEIRYTTYAHMGNGVWSSVNGVARAGAVARNYNPNGESWGQWGDKRYTSPLSHGRQYTEKEIWANFEYFIKAVAPVAKENNVRIGILPDDPPIPKLAGVPRLFSSFAGYQRAIEIAKSPNVGLCLSIGTWAKVGNKLGKDTLGMIDYFGKQNKLFKIRVSNIDQAATSFTETFVDTGVVDIYIVMKALKRVNFDGIVIADHIPQMITTGVSTRSADAYDPSLAWTVGYIKCLRDRVEEEAAIA